MNKTSSRDLSGSFSRFSSIKKAINRGSNGNASPKEISSRGKFPHSYWDIANRWHIFPDTIASLGTEGWKLTYFGPERYRSGKGFCNFDEKDLLLREGLDAYERDKTICHEVVHANYGFQLSSDGIFAGPTNYKELITEYVARQIRADPQILAKIWETFEMNPVVYDEPSYKASRLLPSKQQSFFDFFGKGLEGISLMD